MQHMRRGLLLLHIAFCCLSLAGLGIALMSGLCHDSPLGLLICSTILI